MSLRYKIKPSKSGRGDSLVIFLHGYGANGADLLGLADVLSPHLVNTIFVAPDAPQVCSIVANGYQWFPLSSFDGSSFDVVVAGIKNSVIQLEEWLVEIKELTQVPTERTFLFGFSQGTMMALHIAPQCQACYGGVVGFSGRLLSSAPLRTARHKPPILLLHGDEDNVVPYTHMAEAAEKLTKANFKVEIYPSNGTAHGITPDGLGVALAFMQKLLG